jgi:hypothetical protein
MDIDGEDVDFDASDEEDFQDAPTSHGSKHLQLVEYANKFPGRLASRLLLRMKDALGREGGATSAHAVSEGAPVVATPYFLGIMIPHYNAAQMPHRLRREMRTMCLFLNLLASNQAPRAADLVAQRIKALERSMVDNNWWRAQHLELIPSEGATLIDRDEEMMIALEDALHRRLNAPQWNSWS